MKEKISPEHYIYIENEGYMQIRDLIKKHIIVSEGVSVKDITKEGNSITVNFEYILNRPEIKIL